MDDRINIWDNTIDDIDYMGLPVIHHTQLDFYNWLKDIGLRETRNIICSEYIAREG